MLATDFADKYRIREKASVAGWFGIGAICPIGGYRSGIGRSQTYLAGVAPQQVKEGGRLRRYLFGRLQEALHVIVIAYEFERQAVVAFPENQSSLPSHLRFIPAAAQISRACSVVHVRGAKHLLRCGDHAAQLAGR